MQPVCLSTRHLINREIQQSDHAPRVRLAPMLTTWWILWVAVLLGLPLHASALSLDSGSPTRIDLVREIEILEDPSAMLGFDEVTRPELAARFVRPRHSSGELNLGFSTSAFWMRVPLQRTADSMDYWLLVVPNSLLDEIDLYIPGHAMACWRRFKIDQVCRLNFDQGPEPGF